MKALVSVTAIFAAVFSFSTPASAAADGFSAPADLNGDGVLDQVAVRTLPNDPNRQAVVATIGRVSYLAYTTMNNYPSGIQPPRVTDVNADGRDEVVVTESVGANTYGFSMWVFDHGFHKVTRVSGDPLQLWEGGGYSAILGYGCEFTGGQNQLFTVRAQLVDEASGRFEGERATFELLDGGVARMTTNSAISGTRAAPVFRIDPRSCA